MLLVSCSERPRYMELPVEEYRDRMKAAWMGQMAGVGWGLPTEFDYIDRIIPVEEVPPWTPGMINQQGNDDLYVEMTFLSSMERHGTDVSQRQVGIDFANTSYGLWAANRNGRENLRAGIAPPASGHPRYNPHCEDIDYQIEADYSGIIAPGMPGVAIRLGEKFGQLMNYGDGVYAGQFVGGMYAAAYFTGDLDEIIREGLACIPLESNYARVIRDVIAWHREYPADWSLCWERIMEKYYRTLDHQPFHREQKEAWVGIDAKLNGAFIVLGLLYGKGDLDSTIIYSMRCGLDSDCNPSNAAGILATTIGYDRLPEKFKAGLDTVKKFSYTDYDFRDLLRVSEEFTRVFVVREGGKIGLDKQGNEVLYIRPVAPVPSEFQPAYDPGDLDPEYRFSATELDLILAYSHLDFQSIMAETAPGWQVFHAGRKSHTGPVEFDGKESVLALAPMSAERGVILEYISDLPDVNDEGVGPEAGESGRAVLSFLVNADIGKPWELSLRVNSPGGRVALNETIDRSVLQGWRKMVVPFDYAGGHLPRIRIVANSVPEGEPCFAYLADLRVDLKE